MPLTFRNSTPNLKKKMQPLSMPLHWVVVSLRYRNPGTWVFTKAVMGFASRSVLLSKPSEVSSMIKSIPKAHVKGSRDQSHSNLPPFRKRSSPDPYFHSGDNKPWLAPGWGSWGARGPGAHSQHCAQLDWPQPAPARNAERDKDASHPLTLMTGLPNNRLA